MTGTKTLVVLALALTAVAVASDAGLRWEFGQPSMFEYEIESAASTSNEILGAAGVPTLKQLPPDFSLSGDGLMAPYYHWHARVRVTPRCHVAADNLFYSVVELLDTTNHPVCNAAHHAFCVDQLKHQQMIGRYPIGLTQNEFGEIVAIDIDSRLAGEPDAVLVAHMIRAFVRQLSTFVPPPAFNITEATKIERSDAVTGARVRFTVIPDVAAPSNDDDDTDDTDAAAVRVTVIDKRVSLPPSKERSQIPHADVREQIEQMETTRVVMLDGVMSRLSTLNVLSVKTQYKHSQEWKEATTVLTRSNMIRVERTAAATTAGSFMPECTNDQFVETSSEDAVLLQMPHEHNRLEATEEGFAAGEWGTDSAAVEADEAAASESEESRFAETETGVTAPAVQDVVGLLQRVEVAFKALDGLTEQVLGIEIITAEIKNYIIQMRRFFATDNTACSIQWSKMFVAMASKSEGSAGGGDAMSGGKKLSQHGLLFMLTNKVATAPKATEAGEQYPTEVNLDDMINTIGRPIVHLLDDSEFSDEAKQLLGLSNPNSPFSQFRTKILAIIQQALADAKKAVKAPKTGVAATFDAITRVWSETVDTAPALTASSQCAASKSRMTAGIRDINEQILALEDSLKKVGLYLAQARAAAHGLDKAIPGGLKALTTALGAFSFRVEKSFGDSSMVKATVYSEIGSRINAKQQTASLSVSAGVYAEALGRKGSVVELSYAPTFSSNPNEQLFTDGDVGVSIMGMKLAPMHLSPSAWIGKIVPAVARRLTESLTDTEPVFKHAVVLLSALLRDPNSFGGAFFRPPIIKPAPITQTTLPKGWAMVEQASGMGFDSDVEELAEAEAELEAEIESDAETGVDTSAESGAAAARRRASVGVLSASGARIRSSVKEISSDPLYAMYFRALKTVITSENENGETVAINERSLPSVIHVLLQETILLESIRIELAADAGLKAELAHFDAAIEFMRAVGSTLVQQLWSGVAAWQPLSTDPLIDRQIQSRFGALKGAPQSTAISRLSQAVSNIARIGQAAPPPSAAGSQRRSQRSRDSAPTYFPPPTPAGALGPFLTAIKTTPAFANQLKTIVENANKLNDLISPLMTGAGDLVSATKRAGYLARWNELGVTFKEAATNLKQLSTLFAASKETTIRVFAMPFGDQSDAATRLGAFADAMRAFMQSFFVDARVLLDAGATAATQFWTTHTPSTATALADAVTEKFKPVTTHLTTVVEPKLNALYTEFLAESNGKGIAGMTDKTKPEYRIYGLIGVLKSSVTLSGDTVFLARMLGDFAVAMNKPQPNVGGLKNGAQWVADNTIPEWGRAADSLLDASDSIDFRPNRWLSSVGTARDSLQTVITVLKTLRATADAAFVKAVFSAVQSSTVSLDLSGKPTPSAVACMGGRRLSSSSKGQKTLFSRDFQLLSVQLGPFPVGPISVMVGLGLQVHTHLDLEYGLCVSEFANTNGVPDSLKSNQIAVVTDLTAKLVGDVSVGVGVPFLSMGVQIAITFLDVHLPAHTYLDTQRSAVSIWGKPYIEALAGEVRAYVDIWIRFAVTIYKWSGTRAYLPNTALCTQSRDDMGICPPADGWDKRASTHSSGAVASPQTRPQSSGKCVACNYISQYWSTAGYFTCPLIPKRFAAAAGYAGATTAAAYALLTQIDLRHDKVEFLSICQETYRPLSLTEYSAGANRATYTATICLRQHVDVPRPKLRAFRVSHGVTGKKDAFVSAEIHDSRDPAYQACIEFQTRHDAYTNGLKPLEGAQYWRRDDANYLNQIFSVAPRFELALSPNKAVPRASVPFLSLAGPKSAHYEDPIPTLTNDALRTGQCVRCRNTIQGKPGSAFECPMQGRRWTLFSTLANRHNSHPHTFARATMAAVATAMEAKSKPLPESAEAYVFICDEYVPNAANGYWGGAVFIRDPAKPHSLVQFLSQHYECYMTKSGQKCGLMGELQATAYESALMQLAEKTYEYTIRTLSKFMPCRPAPLRVHRPSDKLKASGICSWCTAYGSELTCGERVHTDSDGAAGEIRGRRFGPLEGIPPQEFEQFSARVNSFATAGYKAIRNAQPRWPAADSDSVKHIALCDEHVLIDSATGGRPLVTFEIASRVNANSRTEYKTEYVFTVTAGTKPKPTVWNTASKTWPDLMRLDTEFRHKYPAIEFPDFPSDGDPFLKLFGAAGGEPDAKLVAERIKIMTKYFNEIVSYQSVWNDLSFGSFFGFDEKLPNDGTVFGAFLCVNIDHSLADCVKVQSKLANVVGRATIVIDKVTPELESSTVKSDRTMPYFFQKVVMDALAATDSTIATRRCDALPPGMAADPQSGIDNSEYVD